jgi:hypothetical protein
LSFARTDTLALAAGVLLLVDVLRVWLPSIITIFGQAASTPAELMGAFALLWFVIAVAAVPLGKRVGTLRVAIAGALGLAAARLALVFVHGGQPQLRPRPRPRRRLARPARRCVGAPAGGREWGRPGASAQRVQHQDGFRA